MAKSTKVQAHIEEEKKDLYDKLDQHLSQETNQIKKIKPGDIVEGIVMDRLPGAMIVDIGYKSEGIVADKELNSQVIDVEALKTGDKVTVYVVKTDDDDGNVILSIKRTDQARKWLELEEAMNNNKEVEAEVIESNNGGVICELGGGIRGFIPTSQLDAARVYVDGVRKVGRDISSAVQKRLSGLIGEKISARIAELNREKNKIILSEKMFLQERDLEQREETLKSIREGDTLEGEVSGITPYGIFVNAQGLEGLVHLSELSWDKVERIEDIYSIGDKVKVQVIGVADNGKRVAYSVKRLLPDPWQEAIAQFKVGDVVSGKVQKIAKYGAFVRIGKGLNGLIHISEMSDQLVRDPHDFVKEGEEVNVKILSISTTERHLGLSLKGVDSSAPVKSTISTKSDAAVKKLDSEELAEKIDTAIEEELN
ncbi:S1 RNA-binding domain-containing protein [Candidatus Dojkabacteria bacterium]|nr:S1 RNA-binding domain-containing protein [Candidatus Dojkabacteria bacterium]